MDLKLEMYDIRVPRGCVVVLYLRCGVEFGVVGIGGGGNVWYVFGGKMVVVYNNALFNILDVVWYLYLNSLMMSMRVLVPF